MCKSGIVITPNVNMLYCTLFNKPLKKGVLTGEEIESLKEKLEENITLAAYLNILNAALSNMGDDLWRIEIDQSDVCLNSGYRKFYINYHTPLEFQARNFINTAEGLYNIEFGILN